MTKICVVELTSAQREHLQALTRSGETNARRWRRARALLLADRGRPEGERPGQMLQPGQQEAKEEGMSPQMFQKIMRSARQDSTLRTRLQTAMKVQRKKQRSRMKNPTQQNR